MCIELPFGAGHAHFNDGIAAQRCWAAGKWRAYRHSKAAIRSIIYSSRDSEYTGLSNRPDLVGDPSIPAARPGIKLVRR